MLIKDVNLNPSRLGILKILKQMNAKIMIINKQNYKGEFIGNIKIGGNHFTKDISKLLQIDLIEAEIIPVEG